jgi:hypothetical protein
VTGNFSVHICSSTNNIFTLSETHTNESLAKEFSYALWPLRSAGVAIIVLNKFLSVSMSFHNSFSFFITVEVSHQSWFAPITLTVVYVPSKCKSRIKWLIETLSSISSNLNTIVISDFNFVEKSTDHIGGKEDGGLHEAKEFSFWFSSLNMIDP